MMTSKKYNDENINLKIIKSTPTPIPKKKGFWSSLFDDSSSEENLKEPKEPKESKEEEPKEKEPKEPKEERDKKYS